VISFDEALGIVVAHAKPLGAEDVALADASGRVLAAPVIAAVDSPPFDVSAMDGYAVRDEYLASTSRFRVVGAAYPGAPFEAAAGPAECVRLFTGAAIPAGADRVIIQENIRREADWVIVEERSSAKRHIRARGGDFRVGDRLLDKGRLLDPRAMVAAAGADVAELRVWRRPRLSIINTGDELVAPGEARSRPNSIPESVSFGVIALAETWGAELVGRQRLPDDVAAIEAGAAAALAEADILIVAGGASVGDKDFAKDALSALGTDILFSKVAMMPGKPVWFARSQGCLVLGLPGNPSSAMVTARLFLAPLVAGMSGRDPREAHRWRRAHIAESLAPSGDRETFVRARCGEDGIFSIASQDSGMQLALVHADLLLRRPPNAPALEAGSEVDVLDF
jgi:molybdopterin molybdotransferase